MSVPETPRPVAGPQPAPASRRGGCLPVLLALLGIVLMLPGICSAGLRGGIRGRRRNEPRLDRRDLAVHFLLAAAGIALIVGAIRRA